MLGRPEDGCMKNVEACRCYEYLLNYIYIIELCYTVHLYILNCIVLLVEHSGDALCNKVPLRTVQHLDITVQHLDITVQHLEITKVLFMHQLMHY